MIRNFDLPAPRRLPPEKSWGHRVRNASDLGAPHAMLETLIRVITILVGRESDVKKSA